MAASFPNAKKTFSSVVNGVTKLVAALFNSPYDEIEAEQTFIGATGGGALAYTTSITDLMSNYRTGCGVEYKSAADLYVRSGELMILDASGNRRLRRNTSDTTVTWANIDTGAEAGTTAYYVYAVADASATTFTVKVSTSATTPASSTFYRLIGVFYNDPSSNIQEVSNLNQSFKIGNLVTQVSGTVYFAYTDGLIQAYLTIKNGTSANYVSLTGYSDGSNPPTTVTNATKLAVVNHTFTQQFNIFYFVKKGNYYKTTIAEGDAGDVSASVITFAPLS
jgi:hypothetical protein